MKHSTICENIIESLSDGVVGIDNSGRVTVFNQSAERVAGVSSSMAVGKTLSEVFPKDAWLKDMLETTLTRGKVFIDHDNVICQRTGGATPVAVSTSTVLDSNGNTTGAVALLRDLSSIKTIKEESVRKDRLAFLGTFAAGIAHEVKNPLGGIRGAAQLLSRRVKENGLSEYTDVIIREVDRLNRILEEILDFANPRRINASPMNIHEALDTTLLISAAPAEEKGARIVKAYDPSLPLIVGDRELLIQVFLNIIKNSIEAVGHNGEITVSTRMITDFHLAEEGYRGKKMASIDIRDNGCGIPNEIMEKIFTPFFTTKPKGSGLGLALSFRIAKEHGGFFKIDSSPEKGTVVSVFLPTA